MKTAAESFQDLTYLILSEPVWLNGTLTDVLFPESIAQRQAYLSIVRSHWDSLYQKWIQGKRSAKLGYYHEQLLCAWFDVNPHVEQFVANYQLTASKVTVGAPDFLILVKGSNTLIHLEVALKFYLATQALPLAQHWVGPSLKDNFKIKRDHLLQSQLPLGNRLKSPIAAMHFDAVHSVARVNGRMFYPLKKGQLLAAPPDYFHPLHAKGWWCYAKEVADNFSGFSNLKFIALDKLNWFSPFDVLTSQPRSISALAASQIAQPVQLVLIDENDTELNRGFVVPNNWGL